MRTVRTILAAGVVAVAAWAPAAAEPTTQPATQPTTQPAARPTTQPVRAKLGPVLKQRWKWYKAAWASSDIVNQSNSDAALVDAILRADPAEVAMLRDEMAGEYKRLASSPKPDEFQQGRLAARLVVAWRRVPNGKEASSAQKALNQAVCCRQMARWSTAALKHLASGLGDEVTGKYRSFVPGTAASVMSLLRNALPFLDNPADLRDELVGLRDALGKLAVHSQAKAAETRKAYKDFYDDLAAHAAQQPAKTAVGDVIRRFPKAYNARDTKAFASLWPAGHSGVANLKDAELADVIPADLWKITHWRCAYVLVRKNRAAAYVVTQYQTKDGKNGEFKLQLFPAAKDENEGWKLD